MEEENKEVVVEEQPKQEVVEAEQPKEQPKQEQQSSGMDEDSKYSLISFILAVVGLAVCAGWLIGSVASVVLGAITLISRCPNNKATKQPFRVFDKITKPVAIVDIALGAVLAIVYLITTIIAIVGAVSGAAAA